ncbi:hypothetical protein AA313_de0208643 [Arthrobotrys entomopaga]|nr:hypothetical protein AA313_de0208643 [Arthrobotrys entomopaga]
MANQAHLLTHFQDRARKDQNDGWSTLWDSDRSNLWDRGKPSPALIDFVEGRGSDFLRNMNTEGRSLKALVPGCGRGYDVVMLGLHGFDAYGLEVSAKAVETAKEYANTELISPSAHHYGDQKADYRVGSAKFVLGDFFKKDWEINCGLEDGQKFDLIYDYTFLCALLAEMRADWARRMKDLLSPEGILVCLEFPRWKDHQSPGPPWGLDGVYWNLLAEGKDGILTSLPVPSTENVTDSGGSFRRLLCYKPDRSYDQGRGTDMVSVWQVVS